MAAARRPSDDRAARLTVEARQRAHRIDARHRGRLRERGERRDRQQLVAMLVAAAHRALARRRAPRRRARSVPPPAGGSIAVRGRDGCARAMLPGMVNAHLPVAQARRIAGERGGHGEELNARQSEEEDGSAQAGSGHDESVYIEAGSLPRPPPLDWRRPRNPARRFVDHPSGNPLHCLVRGRGAVAQLGERLNGIQEVEGSIPFGSTRPSFPVSIHRK